MDDGTGSGRAAPAGSVTRAVRIAAVVAVLGLVALAVPAPASGHPGPGGAPLVDVSAAFQSVAIVPTTPGATVNPEWGYEEYQLTAVLTHQQHGFKTVTASGDYDTTRGLTLPFGRAIAAGAPFANATETYDETGALVASSASGTHDWSHLQCTPALPLTANVVIVELDSGNLAGAIIGTAAGIGAALLASGVTVGGGIPVAPFIGAAVGVTVKQFIPTDRDDIVGTGAVSLVPPGGPSPSTTFLPATSPNPNVAGPETGIRGADITYTHGTITTTQPGCPTATSTTTIGEQVEEHAGRLVDLREQALAAAPSEMSGTRVRQQAVADLVVSVGRSTVGLLVVDAAPLQGGADAVEVYQGGVGLLDEDPDAALAAFAEAAVLAAAAIDGGEEAADPAAVPPQLAPVISTLVLGPYGEAETPVVVLGDTVNDVEITGVPDGADLAVLPGFAPEAVALAATLDADEPDLAGGQVVGTARVAGGETAAPGGGCDGRHLVAAGGAGITVDGRGPYPQPDDACGYGRILTVPGVAGGGALPGDDFADGVGAFTVRIAGDDVAAGSYPVDITAATDDGAVVTTVTLEVPPPPAAPDRFVDRVAGPTRVETAVALSSRGFAPGVPVAMVASSVDFPDALAAGPATRGQGPVLLVPPHQPLPAAVADELARLAPGRVVIVGGTAAIPQARQDEIAAAVDAPVERVAGRDRFATAAAVAGRFWPDGADFVAVATGVDFPDALAAGAWAGREGGPVLLVAGDLPPHAAAALDALAPQRIGVAGGLAAVPEDVVTALGRRVGSTNVVRAAGADRLETAGNIAEAGFDGTPFAYAASAVTFADALAAVPSAIADGAPVVLVPPRGPAPPELGDLLGALGVTDMVVTGGEAAVSAATAASLRTDTG